MATQPAPGSLDPTNRTVEIKLTNGKTHILFFDLNTFFAFEEQAKKTLPSFLVELEQAFAPLLRKQAEGNDPEFSTDSRAVAQALGKLSVKDMRALIWSALHEYDRDGEPKWPYTIGKLGGLIDHTNLSDIMASLMAGVTGSMPRSKPKEDTKEAARPTVVPETPSNTGKGSGSSDEEILGSLDLKSDA